MKYIFFLLFPLFSAIVLPAQQKRIALIVTIDNYPKFDKGGWQRTWANSDLEVLWNLFHKDQKFSDVDTLTEANATRENILNALDKLARKLEKGDIAVFSFSGHGQQIYDVEDKNKGLLIDEADGYDESLVPYDALSMYIPGKYHGEKHIRDEELQKKFETIRGKIGPSGSFLVLVDACHSASITKAPFPEIIFRGTTGTIEPPKWRKKSTNVSTQNFLIDKYSESGQLAPFVVISGSEADQLNYPVWYDKKNKLNRIGALTLAFSKAISNFSTVQTNYRYLFETIRQLIKTERPSQNPVMEGADSLAVLANKVIRLNQMIVLEPVPWKRDSARISQGLVHELIKGMEFFVFPLEDFSNDTSKAVAKGVITETYSFDSEARLNKKLSDSTSYKIHFTKRVYGNFECGIALKGSNRIFRVLADSIARFKNYRITDQDFDLAIKELSKTGTTQKTIVAVRSRPEYPLFDTIWRFSYRDDAQITPTLIQSLLNRIKLFARANFLRSLNSPINDRSLSAVTINIIPVEAHFTQDNLIMEKKKLNADSLVKAGKNMFRIRAVHNLRQNDPFDGFKLQVINKGFTPVYLSLIIISPKDSFYIRIPYQTHAHSGKYPYEEFKILADDSSDLRKKVFAFFEPARSEYITQLKLILTDSPLNLEPLAGGTKSGGAETLNDFLEEVMNDQQYDDNFTRTKDGAGTMAQKTIRPGKMKIISLPVLLISKPVN